MKVTSATSSYTYVSVGYYGITNQFEVWLIYLWGAYTVYLWWKSRATPMASEADANEFKLARLALLWVLVVFLGYLFLFYYGRITYPYYFISAVPALAMGGRVLPDPGMVPAGDRVHLPRGRLPLVLHLLPRQGLPPDPGPRLAGTLGRLFTNVLIG